MTQNLEQRTEVAVTKYEKASNVADNLVNTDAIVDTPVGPRESFPRLSRRFSDEYELDRQARSCAFSVEQNDRNDAFNVEQNVRESQFQSRFSLAENVAAWVPKSQVSNPFQRYFVGVFGEDGYKELLPNPTLIPFETSNTIAEDMVLNRWQENSVASKYYADETVSSANGWSGLISVHHSSELVGKVVSGNAIRIMGTNKSYMISGDSIGKTISRLDGNALVFDDETRSDLNMLVFASDALSVKGVEPNAFVHLQSDNGLYVCKNYNLGNGIPVGSRFLNPVKSDNKWWIPPVFKPLPSGEYTSNGVNSDWVDSEYYKELETLSDIKVTKSILGQDCTGTYNIYKYVFEPHKYDNTILLFSGVHGTERQAFHQLGRFINHLYRTHDHHLADLRNNTRVIVIPVCNPSGVANNTYRTADNLDINRDYDFRTPFGETMFKAVETRIIRDVIAEYKNELSFIMDWHTVANHSGYGDIYLVYKDTTPVVSVMEEVASYFGDMFKRIKDREPEYQIGGNLYNNSVSWGWSCEGVVTVIPETNENTWGNDFNDEYHCYKALEFYGNAVLALLRSDVHSEAKEINSAFGGRFNYQWSATEILTNVYDPLVVEYPSKISKTNLGKDASGSFDIPKYQITRDHASKKILIFAGVNGRTVKGAMALAQFIDSLVRNPYQHENINSFDIDIVPILNVWGMNQGDGYGTGSNRVMENANGVKLKSDFSAFSQVESQYLKTLVDSHSYDYCIDVDSFESKAQAGVPFELYVPFQAESMDSIQWLAEYAMSKGYTYYWQKQSGGVTTPEYYIYQSYNIPSYKIILNDKAFSNLNTFDIKEMRMSVDYIKSLLHAASTFSERLKRLNITPRKLSKGLTVNYASLLPFKYREVHLQFDFGYPDGDSGADVISYTREQLTIRAHNRHYTASASYMDAGAVKTEFANIKIGDTGQQFTVYDLHDEAGTKPIYLSSVYYM